jgi:hypothetical protein
LESAALPLELLPYPLLAFFMKSMFTAELAKLLELKLVGCLLLILGGGIILTFAGSAIQSNDDAHILLPHLLLT